MNNLCERLEAPANWLRQDRGEDWNAAVNRYDRAPFEAAAYIRTLSDALAALVERERLGPKDDIYHNAVAALAATPKPT